MSIALSLLAALLLDYWFKEPKRFHPLVGFGNMASLLEKRFNLNDKKGGVLAWCLAVLPWVFLGFLLQYSLLDMPVLMALVAGVVLYFGLGWQSLLSHGMAIAEPLKRGDLQAARQAVSMIVSRDTSELEEEAIASAATESVLENGADAIFSALFWFCLLGIPGVILYRLSNTLDAMWGYKNTRYVQFGWCAARIDDLLNFVPARLTAASYALLGDTAIAIKAWREQGRIWKSPNAGPVMASGAGAINVSLGGAAIYHGELQQRPALGPETGDKPSAESIKLACELVNRVLIFWVVLIYVVTAVLVSVQSASL
ncbi:adenosylcobinamide-phosphate synthase CbiB [Neptuniibacter marinus]|uniref:adenosylcobinamide-phosphate synthase CbiB n=1 Tax=Neptuniibacter marinus TaxID=1806670 RepID=UPI000836ADBD|nr:adenosylcobinamide-phosphate synthase CbiB [Neptuniibacter marinus]